jgi:hypothetical protein
MEKTVEAQGMFMKVTPKMSLNIYIRHMSCPLAEAWRSGSGHAGWPCFVPTMHERYDTDSVFLECEACSTHIRHITRNETAVEST